MKVLVAGSLTPGSATSSVLDFLENGDCDVYLQPSGLTPPVSEHVANLLTKALDAPFDLLLTVHDIGHIVMSESEYTSTHTRVAYVLPTTSKGWTKNVVKRLRPFQYVVPADEEVYLRLRRFNIAALAPSTPAEVAAFAEAIAATTGARA